MNGISSPAMGGTRSLGYHTTLSPAERSHFVPFSENTKGRSGRPVFIDARLLPQFLSLVDVDSPKGQRIVRNIESLRSLGGGISSYQSTSRAARHMSKVEDMEIYYFIEQAGSDHLPSGLLITGVKKRNFVGNDAPGMYWVQTGMVEKSSKTFFSTSNASICASGQLSEAALNAEQYAPHNGWGGKDALDLFFIPSSYSNDEDLWLTPLEKTADSREISKKVATTIAETQKRQVALNKTSPIHIQVHGSATNVISSALDLCNTHLDKLDFQFIEPVGNVDLALVKLKTKNGNNSHPIISTTKASLISLSRIRKQTYSLTTKRSEESPKSNSIETLTHKTSMALNIGKNQSKHGTFLNSAKQANRLGHWGKA